MKMSLYAGPPVKAVLEAVTEPRSDCEVNRSGRINAVADRYLAMVRDQITRMAYSKGEWCAIMDANNGGGLMDDRLVSPTMIWANVADTAGLDAKWGIDQEALVAKLRSANPSHLIALLEVIDRFWSRWVDYETDDALMGALGWAAGTPGKRMSP